MIKFILGPSGSGKSKEMLDMIDININDGVGEIVFLAAEDFNTANLPIKVRFINVNEYQIENLEQLKGFIAGIFSMNYDIEKVYFDGIYKISKLDKDAIEKLSDFLCQLIGDNKTDVIIGLDNEVSDIPEAYKAEAIELEI